MSSNFNWNQPIYGADVQTSQAYLQRLQEFLAAQSGGVGDNQANGNAKASSSGENHKRKSPGDSIDTAGALKDRRQSGGASSKGAHTHVDSEDRNDRSESPEQTTSSKKKGSTSDKRKEQNRNAQRAFRERKEKVLRDLEEKIEGLNKVNDQQNSENQNLRELVERLQQENARLQQAQNNQPHAPQSDFTFRSQPAPVTASSSSAGQSPTSGESNVGPASLSDQDILAFLNQPAPTFPQQQQQPAYTMIQPSQQGSGSSSDWLWNASTFGTEIPQAIPLDVTNLADPNRSQSSSSIFPWADTGNNFAVSNNISASNNAFPNANVNNNDYASFLTGYSAFSPNNGVSQGVSQPASTQQSHRSSSGGSSQANSAKSQSGSENVRSKAGSNHGGATAESPETTCSSSGSDPSDAFPATPSSAPFPFISNGQDGTIDFSAMFGQNQSGFGDIKASPYSFLTSPGLQGPPAVKTESPQSSFFGSMQATTPSGVFDALNYRDPLLADLDDTANASSSFTFANLDNKNDNFDMSEFLVASPQSQQGAAIGPSPPAFPHHSSSTSMQSGYASSSGSVPTLGSQPYARSSSSGQSSSAASPQSSSVPASGQVTLPYSMTYGHPLATYAMKGHAPVLPVQPAQDRSKPWQEYADKIMMSCKENAFREEIERRKAKGGVVDENEMDSLCKDMKVKATCQEMIRQKVQDALDSDEKMNNLYKQYMQEGQKASAVQL